MLRAPRLYSSPYLHCRHSPGEAPSASKRLGAGARPGTRIQTLSLVLENLWLFYEAMRSGKPLACGDERLAQIRAALKNPPRTSDRSREASLAAETSGISKALESAVGRMR
jgi:hypothetical protein